MGGIGAGDQRLGRHAAGVDAGAAEQVPLDDGHGHAGLGQSRGQRGPGLPGADDDGVEAPGHGLNPVAAAAVVRDEDRGRFGRGTEFIALSWVSRLVERAVMAASAPALWPLRSSRCNDHRFSRFGGAPAAPVSPE